ncbi:PRC-barrel domain containing protein [Streptomyces antimicrobicus]|uniref:PRC-barrel domain containing protein n=1 Tax=Streptomyces antimicrobicus TaxID=2883108 RepID=A0ABS8B9N8_9ACTN|nr:PRC-barrel domain containing protein [Streptomyces antimicrobicus]MCB5181268.1 PRC-barrel domain containing protein [Streptomyces antimicrobicus]
MGTEMWGYADSSGHVAGADLTGFKVEASDGSIGRIHKHSADAGRSFIVVDTGPWILGRHVLVPAGLVREVDVDNETVRVAATKQEIKASPDFESGRHDDDVAFIRLIEQYYANRHM